MESELEKFRRRKQVEKTKEEIKTKFRSTVNSWAHSFYQALLPNWNDEDEEEEDETGAGEGGSTRAPQGNKEAPDGRRDSGDNLQHQSIGDDDSGIKRSTNKWIIYIAIFFRFLAWLLVYIGFLKIGFGAVFFTISLLAFIYWNTRQDSGRKRRKGEVSAYSVFNKDCQAIDGTLKAEHLEKQLLYRS